MDPGYEAGGRAAKFIGAKTISVPLTKDYKHDVKAMSAASPDAGVIYIRNPNNPTGTLTPKEDIEWPVANKPKGAVVLIDDAYTHIAGAPFNTALVAQDKGFAVLRTFSRIYGTAGLRAGPAIAAPISSKSLKNSALACCPSPAWRQPAPACSRKNLVPERRKILGGVREDTVAFLEKHNFTYVPPVSNCFMVYVKQPGINAVMALRKENVYMGACGRPGRLTFG